MLRPDTRRIALWVTYSYWSSAASEDVNSIETLDFELAHPLCLVSEVLIRPFKADFQEVLELERHCVAVAQTALISWDIGCLLHLLTSFSLLCYRMLCTANARYIDPHHNHNFL